MDPTSIEPWWLKFLAQSPALALVLVMWFQQRDQTKILETIRDRLARVLESQRTTTPIHGVPIRRRSRAEVDTDSPTMSRTVTDDDVR